MFTQEGDIKFFYNADGPATIRVSGYELLRDPGFETAVLISILSDARADATDTLPTSGETRRGWWGSQLIDHQLGSKLWLLERSKITDSTLALAEQYVNDALDWLKTDDIAQDIHTVAARDVSKKNQINFKTTIKKTDSINVTFKYFINWEYQTSGGLD
jgi:phage gp46-like protein